MAARRFSRHACARCGAFVFPFSRFEERTEAPVTKDQPALLLTSWNQHNREERIGWCFACVHEGRSGWQSLEILFEGDLFAKYRARKGVVLRRRKNGKG